MKNNKYVFARHLIYETIKKQVVAEISPIDIAEFMFDNYRLEVTLHDISKDMVLRMYQILAEQCWFDINKKHYIGD